MGAFVVAGEAREAAKDALGQRPPGVEVVARLLEVALGRLQRVRADADVVQHFVRLRRGGARKLRASSASSKAYVSSEIQAARRRSALPIAEGGAFRSSVT